MIAEKDKVYSEAANSIYEQNSDETVRMMCEARREAIFHEQYVQNKMERLEKQLSQKYEQLSQKDEQLSQKDEQLSQKEKQLSQKDSLIEQLQAELEKYKNN
ncbi:MAG: hypothetical protein IJU02_02775 [Lachnospiraceae bacterium]|nr:hypothetical protein [Lachnospiraceae bacterium]